MKSVFLLLGFLACAYGACKDEKSWFGSVVHSKFKQSDHARNLNVDVRGVIVHFHDLPKESYLMARIKLAASEILNRKNLDKNKKFIIFVGGYRTSIETSPTKMLKQTFRNFPNSYLIILDHSSYTNDKTGLIESYERAVRHVYHIGKALAEMLFELKKGGISPKNIHCIGHSLGGQMLGNTGEIFLNKTGEKLWRVTALDPAGPGFSDGPVEVQVRKGVAEYVEVYHCNAGVFGTPSILGDIDFFLNENGRNQPSCKVLSLTLPCFSDQCSHDACIDLWLATVNKPKSYLAYKCENYKAFKKGECKNNKKTVAGFHNPGTEAGMFYVSTAITK